MDTWKRFGEKEVSHSMAHYLQAVAALKVEKGHARVGDIADHLGVSKSGVTSMLRSLERHGLVTHERYGCVELTSTGAGLATRTESSRRVLTVFLTEILGVPETVASEDACMIEHLVSTEVSVELLRLTAFLRSQHPAAKQFRDAYRASPHACAAHAPGTLGTSGTPGAADACGVCADTCLHESLMGDVAQIAVRR